MCFLDKSTTLVLEMITVSYGQDFLMHTRCMNTEIYSVASEIHRGTDDVILIVVI